MCMYCISIVFVIYFYCIWPTNWKRSLGIKFLQLTALTSKSESRELPTKFKSSCYLHPRSRESVHSVFSLYLYSYLYWIATKDFARIIDQRELRSTKRRPRATTCAHALNGTSQAHNNLLYMSVFLLQMYCILLLVLRARAQWDVPTIIPNDTL